MFPLFYGIQVVPLNHQWIEGIGYIYDAAPKCGPKIMLHSIANLGIDYFGPRFMKLISIHV